MLIPQQHNNNFRNRYGNLQRGRGLFYAAKRDKIENREKRREGNTGIGDPAAEGYRLAYEGHVTQGPLHHAEPFPFPQCPLTIKADLIKRWLGFNTVCFQKGVCVCACVCVRQRERVTGFKICIVTGMHHFALTTTAVRRRRVAVQQRSSSECKSCRLLADTRCMRGLLRCLHQGREGGDTLSASRPPLQAKYGEKIHSFVKGWNSTPAPRSTTGETRNKTI